MGGVSRNGALVVSVTVPVPWLKIRGGDWGSEKIVECNYRPGTRRFRALGNAAVAVFPSLVHHNFVKEGGLTSADKDFFDFLQNL